MREPGSGTRQAIEQLFAEHDVSIKVRLELGSNEAIKQSVAGGLGISVLSRHCMALEGLGGQIALLNFEHFPIQRHWNIVYPKGKNLSVVARTFFKYLQSDGKRVLQETAML